jgi:hypothetical protein
MQPVDVKFGEWFERGWKLFTDHAGLLVLSSLIVIALTLLTLGVLGGPLAAGMILIVLRLVDRAEPKPEAGDVFQGFQFFLQAFLFVFVYVIVDIVGSMILTVVPLIGLPASMAYSAALAALLLFALFLIVDRGMDFWPACMASVDKVKTNFWPFFGLALVLQIVTVAGALVCFVGLLVTLPLVYCVTAVAYRDVFAPPAGAEAEVVEPQLDGPRSGLAGAENPPPLA